METIFDRTPPPVVRKKTKEANKKTAPKITLATYNDLLHNKDERTARRKSESFLFFAIGLTLSLLLVVTAFEYEFKEDNSVINLGQTDQSKFEDLMDVPLTEQPPPPPPSKKLVANIVEVEDDKIIEQELDVNFDIEANEETVVEEVVYEDVEPVEEEVAEEIFTVVEDAPQPKGGVQEFYKFIASELKYPLAARRVGIEGRVFIQFVVNKDGSISDAVVMRGIGAGCDEEAVRVIMLSPKWKPGKQRGVPVKVRMVMPIHFKLRG